MANNQGKRYSSAFKFTVVMDAVTSEADNPWIESLWSRLKYEIGQLLYDCCSLSELEQKINNYFQQYIHQRRHQSLDQQIPINVLNNQNHNGETAPQDKRQLVI